MLSKVTDSFLHFLQVTVEINWPWKWSQIIESSRIL